MEWISKHSNRIAIAVILLSFLASAFLALREGSQLRYLDENDYTQIAANLVHQHEFSLDGVRVTAARPPGYPWLLAIPEALHIPNVGIRFFNIGALLICQLLIFRMARRTGSNFTAAIAILLSLCYPVLIYTAALLYPQTVGAALLLGALYFLLDPAKLTTTKALGAGFLLGLLILSIPTFVVLTAGLTFWLFIRRKDFRRNFIAFVAPMFLLIGSWSVRNYIVFHSFVFVATNGGLNLLIGNSENSTMNSGTYTDIDKYLVKGYSLPEVESDKYFKDSAKQWIFSHPKQAFILYDEKFIQYFSFYERTATADSSSPLLEPIWRRIVMLVTYEPLLLLFLIRLALARKYPLTETEICLAGMYILNALFSSLFFPRIRFRLPLDWLLILIDAGMIRIIAGRFAKTEESKIALG